MNEDRDDRLTNVLGAGLAIVGGIVGIGLTYLFVKHASYKGVAKYFKKNPLTMKVNVMHDLDLAELKGLELAEILGNKSIDEISKKMFN